MTIPQQFHRAYVLSFLKPSMVDQKIRPPEGERLYQIFATLEMPAGDRQDILHTAIFEPHQILEAEIPDELLTNDEIRMSLAKEGVAHLDTSKDTSEIVKIHEFLTSLAVRQEQIAFLQEWVRWENRLLEKIGAKDTELADEDNPSELLARATAVGVPLASLYFAGSVGFSAVGLTSGLATLGTISGLTLLGLNPMTAGIAALIVVGISVKKVCDVAFGSGRTKREQKRLQEEIERLSKLRGRARTYATEDLESLKGGGILEQFSVKGRLRRDAQDLVTHVISALGESFSNPISAATKQSLS
ncbi:MAG: hypothetical protein P1V20_31450 [Verrucomicrobiales bacterium]|nr:hypothetical protein [Verrucomicrobiales bacterium]